MSDNFRHRPLLIENCQFLTAQTPTVRTRSQRIRQIGPAIYAVAPHTSHTVPVIPGGNHVGFLNGLQSNCFQHPSGCIYPYNVK